MSGFTLVKSESLAPTMNSDSPRSACSAKRPTGAPTLSRVEKSTLQALAYVQLRDAIMLGMLVPGQAITIRSLAAAIGTSHIPVREALMRLAAERAISVLPNGSVSVPVMSRARFEDLRRTRLLVEGHAVELAAPRLTEGDFRKMETAYRKREAAIAAGNYREAMQFGHREGRPSGPPFCI